MAPSRRTVCRTLIAAAAAPSCGLNLWAADSAGSCESGDRTDTEVFRLRYVLGSALYGKMPLDAILPEVRKAGAEAIDVWCLPHGDQREQADAMGADGFADLLRKHDASLGAFTRYPLGPFRLGDEMKLVKRLGGSIVVSGAAGGPKDPAGREAKAAVTAFLDQMKPHVAAAEAAGVTIAIENHAGSLLSHPDSLRHFADLNPAPRHLGVAFAPHHLHDWADQIPALIEHLGPSLAFFYAQEQGKGSSKPLPKEDELLQLPGFGGGLDYRPIVASLRKIRYGGWVEIFMHPFPRGDPILPTAAEITAAVNRSRAYLDDCVQTVAAPSRRPS